jgi:hypothetical protein
MLGLGACKVSGAVRRAYPKGLKPFLDRGEKPKAEALGYLDARTTTTTEADPYGMTTKKGEDKDKSWRGKGVNRLCKRGA